MRKILSLIACLSILSSTWSQNLSYTCPRDIILACNTPCFTLTAQFPDLRGLADDYNITNVSPTSQCYPIIAPGAPGPSTNLTIDDRYSAIIDLPFNFPFYGTDYSQLIVSANGYISFDVSQALLYAPWSLSATNFPNTAYHRALIAGPWHDLDPSVTTSPSRMIKYNVIGISPTRKWVVSYYKVPLFGSSCNSLYENTHQIILHEGSGVVEVFIQDKQQCPSWNSGRSMVGMQNYDRTKGIVAPGRGASDAPWGSIGMNETWRFTPKDGAPLYRRVELLNGAGAVVATGDTVRVDAKTFQVTFPNICPAPNATNVYVVKTTYQRIDNFIQTFYSLDTINVIRNAPPGSYSTVPTSCEGGSDGSITVIPPAGSPGPITYTLLPNNITQPLATFPNLPAGTYSAVYIDAAGCSNTITDIIVNDGPPLTGTASSTATSCPTANDGTITVTPGGTGPYIFTLNPGNVVQPSNVFTNLAPGTYTITFTTLSGCNGTVTPNPVVNPGPAQTSSATPDHPDCFGINNGSITIVPGGTGPYNFTLTGPGGPYTQTTPTFTGLAPGTYNYTYTDAAGCQGSGTATLTTNPPINTPATLVMPLCNGGNNGSVTVTPNGGVSPYQFSINGGSTYQSSGTINSLPAGSYTIRVRDNVGCIKDTTVMLSEPTLLTASASSVNAGCAGNDGTITVTGTGGTPPYQYSVDGTNYQPSAQFTVSVGDYNNIRVKDANGCVANTAVSVGLTDNMFLELGPDTTICAEASHTFQPQTNPETNVFAWSSPSFTPSSLDNTTIKNATASPLSTTTYILNATWGACSRTDQITVNVLRKPVPNAGEDVMICDMDSTLLAASATNLSGTVNYVWSPAAYVRDDSSATTWAVPDTTRMFIVTVTDNYGCNFSVQDSVLVTMQPPVPAFAGNDTIAILGVPHQMTASGGSTYTWSPSAPLDNPFSPTPMATLSNDTKFTVVINDIAGCVGYDTVFVKVYEGPAYYVPNAFTPNGDGLNDIFRAVPVGIAKTDWFRVFNRYGQVVFETNQWLKGWDGNFMGKLQPMGVYIWIVKGTDRKGRTVEQKGTVMLVR